MVAGEEHLRLLWERAPVARMPGIGFYFSDAKTGIPPVLQAGPAQSAACSAITPILLCAVVPQQLPQPQSASCEQFCKAAGLSKAACSQKLTAHWRVWGPMTAPASMLRSYLVGPLAASRALRFGWSCIFSCIPLRPPRPVCLQMVCRRLVPPPDACPVRCSTS